MPHMQATGKVLIVGGGSLVGAHLRARLGQGRAVVTSHRTPVPGAIAYDARTMSPAVLAEAAAGCSHGVILVANANPDDCARDPLRARQLNVDAVKALIDQFDSWNIVPVFSSTEAVFDGTRGHYTEADAVAPLMVYGAQKVEIETYLARRGRPYLAVRLSRVVTSDPADSTLFSQWLRQIRRREAIRCATDHVFTPIHADDVAEAVTALMDGGHGGLFHVGGPDSLGRLELLQRLVAAWRAGGHAVDPSIQPCRMVDFATVEPRPRDVSLVSDKLVRATGFHPRGMDAVCRALVAAAAGTEEPS